MSPVVLASQLQAAVHYCALPGSIAVALVVCKDLRRVLLVNKAVEVKAEHLEAFRRIGTYV